MAPVVSKSKKRLVSEINITPFVDVMLVLLIIFMVAAPMMQEGIELDLPQTREVDTMPTEVENLIVSIDKTSQIFIDTYKVPFEELEERINALNENKDRPVYLQADKEVSFELVIKVMGEIKSAGIEKIGIIALRDN